MAKTTKRELLELGVQLLLKHGYSGLGMATLLEEAGVPKGSFYHHFKSKEDFGLAVIDLYMEDVHAALKAAFSDEGRDSLDQIRQFFTQVSKGYEGEGYLGCLLGGLGQELSATSPAFREKVEICFAEIASYIEQALRVAKARGRLRKGVKPEQLANLLVNCWEGAALRSRLQRSGDPLNQMLEFYFSAVRK